MNTWIHFQRLIKNNGFTFNEYIQYNLDTIHIIIRIQKYYQYLKDSLYNNNNNNLETLTTASICLELYQPNNNNNYFVDNNNNDLAYIIFLIWKLFNIKKTSIQEINIMDLCNGIKLINTEIDESIFKHLDKKQIQTSNLPIIDYSEVLNNNNTNTVTVQDKLTQQWFDVKYNPISGRSLFYSSNNKNTHIIKKGQVICQYCDNYDIIPTDTYQDLKQRTNVNLTYSVYYSKDKTILPKHFGINSSNLGILANTALSKSALQKMDLYKEGMEIPKQNAIITISRKRSSIIRVKATADIEYGKEILIAYGGTISRDIVKDYLATFKKVSQNTTATFKKVSQNATFKKVSQNNNNNNNNNNNESVLGLQTIIDKFPASKYIITTDQHKELGTVYLIQNNTGIQDLPPTWYDKNGKLLHEDLPPGINLNSVKQERIEEDRIWRNNLTSTIPKILIDKFPLDIYNIKPAQNNLFFVQNIHGLAVDDSGAYYNADGTLYKANPSPMIPISSNNSGLLGLQTLTLQTLTTPWNDFLSIYFNIPNLEKTHLKEYNIIMQSLLSVETNPSVEHFIQVEIKRKPACFHIDEKTINPNIINKWNASDLIEFVGHSLDTSKVQTFSGDKVHLKTLFKPVQTKQANTVVEDLYIKWNDIDKNDLVQFVYNLQKPWNGFVHSSVGKEISDTSLVISQIGARASNHQHAVMFWNYAVKGMKYYILYDSIVAEQKGFITRNDKTIKLKKLDLNQFIELVHSENAFIACTDHLHANYIIVPSRYAHDILTVKGGDNIPFGNNNQYNEINTYAGMVGYALPILDNDNSIKHLQQVFNMPLQTSFDILEEHKEAFLKPFQDNNNNNNTFGLNINDHPH